MWSSQQSQVEIAEDQMTEQCGQCEEVVHVTDSNDLECDQAYYNRCIKDVVLDPDCHYVLLES